MARRYGSIFLDTSFFKGLVDPKDDFHERANKLWSQFLEDDEFFLTTNFILDETFTLVRKRCGQELAVVFKEVIESTKNLRLERISSRDGERVWEWFFNDWSDLSYTDCTSFAVMKRLGLERVATFDEHFARAGFKVVK